jgi:hypothetical protein
MDEEQAPKNAARIDNVFMYLVKESEAVTTGHCWRISILHVFICNYLYYAIMQQSLMKSKLTHLRQ